MLELERITKSYTLGGQQVHALRDVTMKVAADEMLAIMGPSGSGKSTLLQLLGCLDQPTSGSYRFAGQEVSTLSAQEIARFRNRHIGFVFQQFHLLPQLTALENVMLPMVYGGIGRLERRQRAETLLELLGMAERRDHKPTQLSGGQQQRVAIARALAMDPPLIMGDEPTGNLDTATGQEVMQLLHRIHKEGRTILIVTHDPAIAEQCQRCVRIRDGMLEEVA